MASSPSLGALEAPAPWGCPHAALSLLGGSEPWGCHGWGSTKGKTNTPNGKKRSVNNLWQAFAAVGRGEVTQGGMWKGRLLVSHKDPCMPCGVLQHLGPLEQSDVD